MTRIREIPITRGTVDGSELLEVDLGTGDGQKSPISAISAYIDANGVANAAVAAHDAAADPHTGKFDPAGSAGAVQSNLDTHTTDTTNVHGIPNTAALLSDVTAPTDFTATGTPGNTTFLRGDNVWAEPPAGGGGTVSNLAYTPAPSGGTISNTGGDDATLTDVSGVNAGLMVPADKTKLDGIAAGAEVNQVDSVNTQTGAVVLSAADVGADPVGSAASVQSDLNTHTADATGVHGIVDTAALAYFVDHGAVAGTARPAGAGMVIWSGSVQPTNAIAPDIVIRTDEAV